MTAKYFIERRANEGYTFNDGYFTWAMESNKQRAINEAKKVNGRVKEYLTGKIIFDTKEV